MKGIPISPMKVINGQSGKYWCTAESDIAALYVRVGFERGPAAVNGNQVDVDVLQLNFLYFGPQFKVPKPWSPLEVRTYKVDNQALQGVLLGKAYVPLGEYNRNLPMMFDKAVSAVTVLDPEVFNLCDAAGIQVNSSLTSLLELLAENLQNDPLVLEPKAYINSQYSQYKNQVVAGAKSKVEVMKAKASPKPDADDQQPGDSED
jgi:hypothetical protein